MKGRRLRVIIKWILIVIAALVLLTFIVVEGARAATYFSNHITTENGVDEGVYVNLGGQEQYLYREEDDRWFMEAPVYR
jgi:hypothetical protein